MRIPLKKGRYFTEQDKADRPVVAIINETFVKRYWPDGSDPVGQRLRFSARLVAEIVGTVGDVKHSGLDKPSTPTVYTSYLQIPEMKMSLVVRTASTPPAIIRAVNDQVDA